MNFPFGCDAEMTRDWLTKQGFNDFFSTVALNADALLGMNREVIMAKFVGDEDRGEVLVALLNTANTIAAERSQAGVCGLIALSALGN